MAVPKSPIHTGESSRDILGKRGIINPVHGGGLKRVYDDLVERKEEKGLLIPDQQKQEAPMANEAFLRKTGTTPVSGGENKG